MRRAKLDKGNGILIGKLPDHLKQYVWGNMLYRVMKPTLPGPSKGKGKFNIGYQEFKKKMRATKLV